MDIERYNILKELRQHVPFIESSLNRCSIAIKYANILKKIYLTATSSVPTLPLNELLNYVSFMNSIKSKPNIIFQLQDFENFFSCLNVVEINSDSEDENKNVSSAINANKRKITEKNDNILIIIKNLAFQIISSNFIHYYCLHKLCKFESANDIDKLRNHIENEHKIQLPSYCNICNKLVTDSEKLPLDYELLHLSEHVVKTLTCNGSVDKIKRVKKNQINIENNIPESVRNEGISTESVKISSSNFIYKCQGRLCTFASKQRTDFIAHLNKHKKLAFFKNNKDWQKCFYCKYLGIFPSIANLVDHIDTKHKTIDSKNTAFCNSSFSENDEIFNQCTTSIRKSSNTECENFTSDQSKKDVEEKIDVKFMDYVNELVVSMKKYVKPIKCQDCNESFFVIDSYLEHQQAIHFKPRSKRENIKLFCCIFCGFEKNNQDEIIKHMTNFHTEENLCFCARVMNRRTVLSGSTYENDFRNLSIVCFDKGLHKYLYEKEPALDLI